MEIKYRETSGRYPLEKTHNPNAKKVFFSHPMHGLTPSMINGLRDEMFILLKNKLPNLEFEVIDNINHDIPEGVEPSRIWHLGESIKQLGEADYIVFAQNYKDAAGCRVEETVAINYQITRIYL